MTKLRSIAILLIFLYIIPFMTPAFADEASGITVEAKAALLVDLDTETFLLSQNIDDRLYPASLTKIMTVLLALERGNLDDEVTVTESSLEGLSVYGSSVYLQVGEVMRLEDLLYCAMVASANDACSVIAEHISGSIEDFVELMNRKAAELGCENTNFANPHGLHDSNHYTSARDLYKIIKEALTIEKFREIVSTTSYEVPATNLYSARHLTTTNYLLSEQTQTGYYFKYAKGIKTGTTTEAGLCLASYAEKDGMTLVSVVLGASSVVTDGITDQQNFSETKRMFQWGFDNFKTVDIINTADTVAEIPVTLSADGDTVGVRSNEALSAVLPIGYDLSMLDKEITIFYDDADVTQLSEEEAESYSPESLVAPFEAGEVVGTMTVSYNGEALGTVELVTIQGMDRSQVKYRIDKVKDFFTQGWVQLAIGALALAFFIVSITSIRYTIKQQKRRRSLGDTYKGSSLRKPK